jgi:uncharacterized protein (TIGR03437 family)
MRFAIVCFLSVVSGLAQSLWFEPNQGQVHPAVQFVAHTPSGYVYFARDKMAVRDVRMELVGANRRAQAELEEPLGGISSYFIGRSEKDWHTGIPHYGRVRYKNVYSGIDLVYYPNGRDIEYDFILKRGADPNQIKLAYNKPVRIDSNGALLVAGLKQHRPKVLQNGREIECNYLVRDHRVQLALAEYDHSQPLTVDPVLEYSSYLGGPAEEGANDLKVDANGFVLLTGYGRAPNSPDLNPFQQTSGVSSDTFVFKLDPTGKRLVYYAFLGGDFDDDGQGIDIDSGGYAYVSGQTSSLNFPIKNPIQRQFGGGDRDAFVAKLTPDGRNLVYSTYLGGSREESGASIAVDTAGNAYVVGETYSFDFPTKNALQPHIAGGGDAYLVKVAPDGSALLFATYLGGSSNDYGFGVAVDQSGSAYVAGYSQSADFPTYKGFQLKQSGTSSAFVAKFSPAGDGLSYSTFLGESWGGHIAVDDHGNAFVTGYTSSDDFPVKNAFQPVRGGGPDVFLTKLAPSGSELVYSTFLGGTGVDFGFGRLAVDSDGSAIITGLTASKDFPTKNSLQPYVGGGSYGYDAFVTKLTPDGGALVFSTYVGGNGWDAGTAVALGLNGVIWVAGETFSGDFPVKDPFQRDYGGSGDIFLARLGPDAPSPASITATPNKLSFSFVIGNAMPQQQQVLVTSSAPATFTLTASPGWLKISSNTNLTPATLSVTVDPTGLIAGTYTGSIQVDQSTNVSVTLTVLSQAPQFSAAGIVNAASFAGGPVAPGEIVTIFGTNLTDKVTFDSIPATLVFASPTQVNVTVPYSVGGPTTVMQMGTSSVQLQVAPSAPGIFAAVLAGDNILTLFATGCGALTTDDLPRCALPVSVTVNDQPATVLYAGIAPGLVQGANQINVQLPDGIASGQLTIILTAGDASSKPFMWSQP